MMYGTTGYAGAGLAGAGFAGAGYPGLGGGNNCICSLPTLIILILVVLQFSRFGKGCCDGEEDECCGDRTFPVGNGILFIIALFFLTCAGCGRGGY